ncbi:hypothetical protein F2P56_012465 [Juglans regia]|uniref:Uncharacterized protein LOC108987619 n=2 Tax=Juglans regia TaxID=51240 RepID=A0A2I4E9M3_JUGRE|nr:uncharacterized protein LOC108987619 [Juglans regia]KAF5468302.1 hypothetical protein F2P56_012465 [Juglans regia]
MAIVGGGIYELKEDTDVQTQIAALTSRLGLMEMDKVKAMKTVERCSIYADSNHKTQDCPIIPPGQSPPPSQQPFHQAAPQHQYQPYQSSQSYPFIAPPGFQPHVTAQSSQPQSSVKKSLDNSMTQMANTLKQFMQIQATTNNQNTQAINELRGTINKINTTLSTQEKRKFPAQPQPNPQWQQQRQVHNVSDEVFETSKVVLTLRNGKEVPQPEMTMDRQEVAPTPEDATETDEAEKEPEVVRPELKKSVSVDAETSRGYQPVVPYPRRLVAGQKNKYYTKIQEIFKQVKINIPLLDAIQQVPSYTKFLKDLCTVKMKLNVKNKAFLMEQVSALILSETPKKFGDPGSPNISIMIFSVYEQLGLCELKNTSIKVQLSDRSVKAPRGIVENVLVQPATAIYQASIILGCQFLATSNTLINCRSGVLKLTFGNMTLEMNVFNTCKILGDCNESEVHVVEVISEFEEIKREAYDNSHLAKERMKALHDKKIHDKHLVLDPKVLLYNSRLHLFPRKPESRWKGPYIVKKVHPHGAVDIVNPKNENSFTVNGQRLKTFLKIFDPHEKILLVQDSSEVF